MSGLYLHIPFCHSKCAYCDFFSTPNRTRVEEYVDALEKEFHARKGELNGPVTTVYLGGGTPSALPLNLLERILEFIPLENAREITMEVNPEDVTDDLASWIAASEINRVSMGIQSLIDSELKIIGRRHSARDAMDAFARLRHAGIENISVDLIFGLPGQTHASWLHSLDSVLEMKPDHLSAYSLMLEPGTRLWAMRQAGKFRETDEAEVENMYRSLCDKAAGAGMEHYEISNFAMPGKQSLHNSSYWNLTPYLGLGTGAHSFDGSTRRFNPPDIKSYIATGGLITETDSETVTEKINDYIMIRLRTSAGLSTAAFRELFGHEATASRQLAGGLLKQTAAGVLYIPERHFLVSDTVISDLML